MTPWEGQTLGSFLDALAARSPSPGGGAAACVCGATGVALAGMVTAYSLGRKDLAAHQGALEDAQRQLARARSLLLSLAEEDAAAYAQLNALQKLAPDAAARRDGLAEAARACVQIPLAALAACVDVLRLLDALATRGAFNRHLRSDLAIAAVVLKAAGRACAINVRINLPLLPEPAREADAGQCAALEDRAVRLAQGVENASAAAG